MYNLVLVSCLVGPPEFTTFEELQENETRQLLQAFPAVGAGNPPVLLGDFNHGPSIPASDIIMQYESNYKTVVDAGYISPFLNDVTQCTFCQENGLVNTSGSKIIDHIYVRNGTVVSYPKVLSSS